MIWRAGEPAGCGVCWIGVCPEVASPKSRGPKSDVLVDTSDEGGVAGVANGGIERPNRSPKDGNEAEVCQSLGCKVGSGDGVQFARLSLAHAARSSCRSSCCFGSTVGCWAVSCSRPGTETVDSKSADRNFVRSVESICR